MFARHGQHSLHRRSGSCAPSASVSRTAATPRRSRRTSAALRRGREGDDASGRRPSTARSCRRSTRPSSAARCTATRARKKSRAARIVRAGSSDLTSGCMHPDGDRRMRRSRGRCMHRPPCEHDPVGDARRPRAARSVSSLERRPSRRAGELEVGERRDRARAARPSSGAARRRRSNAAGDLRRHPQRRRGSRSARRPARARRATPSASRSRRAHPVQQRLDALALRAQREVGRATAARRRGRRARPRATTRGARPRPPQLLDRGRRRARPGPRTRARASRARGAAAAGARRRARRALGRRPARARARALAARAITHLRELPRLDASLGAIVARRPCATASCSAAGALARPSSRAKNAIVVSGGDRGERRRELLDDSVSFQRSTPSTMMKRRPIAKRHRAERARRPPRASRVALEHLERAARRSPPRRARAAARAARAIRPWSSPWIR